MEILHYTPLKTIGKATCAQDKRNYSGFIQGDAVRIQPLVSQRAGVLSGTNEI